MPQNIELPNELQPILDRLDKNITRTHFLVSVYKSLAGSTKGRKPVSVTDILRAAVVFLHASLEDFLRSIASTYLPSASQGVLDDVPLKGFSEGGRPKKFFLGQLAQYKEKTVAELIDESVAEYLEKSNYNNTNDVAALLTGVGIDVSCVRSTFSVLDQMMARRHQIVHRADWTDARGKGKHHARSLRAADVEKWITVTRDFMSKVLYQIQFLWQANPKT